MRVYKDGKHIPMSVLTWGDMGSPRTLVKWDEDKEATFPLDILRGRITAPLEIAQALGAKKSLIAKLKIIVMRNLRIFEEGRAKFEKMHGYVEANEKQGEEQ